MEKAEEREEAKYSYNTYLNIRATYEKQSQESSNKFDSNIITLSISSLGGGTFFFAQLQEPKYICLLMISRGLTVIAIGITLRSHKISEKTIKKVIKKLDLEQSMGNSIDKRKEINKIKKEIGKQGGYLECMNSLSISSLILGVIFLGVFLYFNVM